MSRAEFPHGQLGYLIYHLCSSWPVLSFGLQSLPSLAVLSHLTLQPSCCFPVSHLTLSCPCLGQNFGLDWCKQPDAGLPKPDLILFLQLNPEAAAERGNFGQERYETSSFQEKVLQCFYCLMEDKTLNWKVRN